jgi:hypothetical protein
MGGPARRQLDGGQAYGTAGGQASLEAGGREGLGPGAITVVSARDGGCALPLGWQGGVGPADRGRCLPDCLGVTASPGSERGVDTAPWRAGWHADGEMRGADAVRALSKTDSERRSRGVHGGDPVARRTLPCKVGRSCQASSDRADSSDTAAVELPSRYWSAA